jgi:hypothetical protein
MIKLHLKIVASSIIVVVFLSVLLLLFMHYVQKKSEAKFSLLFASLKEGMPYSEAEQMLGQP